MKRGYTVSKDVKSGLWYAHMRGYPHIPVGGSFSKKKSEAMEYAKKKSKPAVMRSLKKKWGFLYDFGQADHPF